MAAGLVVVVGVVMVLVGLLSGGTVASLAFGGIGVFVLFTALDGDGQGE